MPLLDIATAQPYFQNNPYKNRSRFLYHGTFICGSEKRSTSLWTSFLISEKSKKFSRLMIKAVATLEPKCSIESNDGHKDYQNKQMDTDSTDPSVLEHRSVSGDSKEVDEREKLRRMRISKANKGNIPWNKGRKHSEETRQRIRERTRLAMQDPKVKMKLVNLGHAQSEETRIKIGVGVRIGWEKRREMLLLQETCHIEWQNLIAEASKRGLGGEEELDWDSYQILDEQLQKEWLESVEQRKYTPRPKGSKRAPKSLEQRRKISAAIAAKWADPEYRDRVYSGLSKYHGTPIGVEKTRRRPTGYQPPRKRSPAKKKSDDTDNSAGNETKKRNHKAKLKRRNKPLFKDPLASSKLEMIKSIRAQRAAAENNKTEAITRAKLLIAEAEKAAKALEVAATRSPLAQASLIESRKLIAEAIQSIKSIESEQLEVTGLENNTMNETDTKIEDNRTYERENVNGARAIASSDNNITDFGFGNFNFNDLLHDEKDEIDEILPSSSYDNGVVNGKEELFEMGLNEYDLPQLDLDNMIKQLDELEKQNGPKSEAVKDETSPNNGLGITKKWVRGKLVEVKVEDED